jgi:tripartite-type tricarboxylate transporter receptor subunit TctC
MVSVFAPAKTPAALINRLNTQIVQLLNQAEVKERLFNAGIEVVGSSPDQLGSKMKSEIARLGKVIEVAGIRSE